MSTHLSAVPKTLQRRTFVIAMLATLTVLITLGAATLFAVCAPNAYTVTSSAATATWTDASGLWNPSGGFPGCATGDSATDTNGPPGTTIIVNSIIPNPLIGLNFSCNGCVIDIQPGGALRLIGSGTVGSGATIKVSGGYLAIENGGSLNFQSGSTLDFTNGIVDVQAGASLALNGAATVSNGALYVSGGTVDVSTTLSMQSGSQLNLNGGSITGSGTVNSAANVQVNSTGTFTIDPVFNVMAGSSGVHVNSGTLSVRGGGTGDAAFMIASAAKLDFPSSYYTMTANGVVSGAGTLSLSGATLLIGGVTNPDYFNLSAGTLDGPGFLDVRKQFDWSGGELTGSGTAQLAGGGVGNFNGAAGDMRLNGRTLNIYGLVHYTATTNELYIDNDGLLSIYGTFNIEDDGSIAVGSAAGGTVNIAPNGYLQKSGGTGTSVIEPYATNTAQVYVTSGRLEFSGGGSHSGYFYAASGTYLRFSYSSTTFDSSSYLNADGTVEFTDGSFNNLQGTYDVNGRTFIGTGAIVVVNAASTTKNFTLTSGATLTVNQDFTMTGSGNWSCGTIGGSAIIISEARKVTRAGRFRSVSGGEFHIDSGATLDIDGAVGSPTLRAAVITNAGLINYTAVVAVGNYLTLMDGGEILNDGTFDIQTDSPILSTTGVILGLTKGVSASEVKAAASGPSNVIDNAGTFEKTAAGGTTNVEPSFTNSGTVLAQAGVLNFKTDFTQTAGETKLDGGDIQTFTTMQLSGGVLDGDGTITGDVQNDANVAPGDNTTTTGVINVTGTYTQGSGGTLTTKIGGPSAGQYDQLTVSGASTLAGTFKATLINSYLPLNGATFPMVTYASESGTFGTEQLPTWPHGSFTSAYNPTAYVLTAVVTPSVADLAIVKSGPATVNAGAALSYTIAITNNGPDPSSGTTTVVDTLPAGVTGASGTGIGWNCGAPSGGTITCTNTDVMTSGGQLATLTIAMTAPIAGGGITNSATVSSSIDNNATNNTSSVPTTVVAQADLSITKNGPAGVVAGQNVTYTIVVTNNGPSSATSVSVSDPPPANLTWVSNSGACTSNFPCSLGTLAANATATITATYSTSPSFSGNVTNTATVSALTADPSGANNSASATTNVGAQADLSVVKSGPASTTPGQNVVYTVTVMNNGPSPAVNTIVNDVTPVGLAFQSNSGACTTAYPCSVGTLASGQSVAITSTYTVPNNYASATINNTASVSSSTNDPNSSNDASLASTTVAQTTDLSISKSGPGVVGTGQNIVYTITVTNLGPSQAAGVSVTDNTPPGLTFVSNSGGCTSTFPCNLGTMNASQTATITSTYSIPANYAGATIVNTASVGSGATDSNSSNNSSTTTATIVASADVAIVKTGPGSFTPGTNIVYTIVVTNNGTASAANVSVADNTPAGLTFVSNSGACTSTFPCSLGTLATSQSATITATYSIPANFGGSLISNTATVTSTTNDPNPPNNSSTTTATSGAAGTDVSIVKSGPASFSAGQNITYTIVVTNNGSSAAANTFVSDSTPSGLTFLGNSGACASAFPCSLGTLGAGQSATITSVYSVPSSYPTASVTNTASVSSSTADPNTTNNTSSVTTPRATGSAADLGITKSGPSLAAPNSVVKFTINIYNNGPAGATNVVVTDPTPAGATFISNSGACTTPFPCTIPSIASQQIVTIIASYRVTAANGATIRNSASVSAPAADPAPNNNQASASVAVGVACPPNAPTPIAPAAGAVIPSPVTFTWSSVPNATSYVVRVTHTGVVSTFTTAATSITENLAVGTYTWTVVADSGGACTPLESGPVRFTVCGIPTTAPNPSVVAETATGQTYQVAWSAIDGFTSYELQEASDAAFANIISSTKLDATSKTFTKSVTSASPFHYRVRGLANCGQGEGPFSMPISIVVLPVPVFDGSGANVNVPSGSQRPVTFQLFVPGFENSTRSFVATVDKPWLAVTPTNGIVPPEGITLLVSADPSSLQNGTWTGTVLVIYGSTGISAKANANASSTSKSFPVSISLVTPVTPVSVTQPALGAVVIPSVGHLPGFASTWRSDVRVANISSQPQNYQLTFNSGDGLPTTALKKTSISIESGATTALDDIVRNWYGIGSLNDASNGLLTIEALDATGKPSTEPLSRTTIVSSRTYNTADAGTLGQFVPAVPFGNFIGRAGGTSPSILSLQQLTQSDNFRTNLGVVEAGGQPVSLIMSVFNAGGTKVLDLPIALRAGEQKQLNSVLASNGIPLLSNGRIEVKVTSGEGKATAYASVVDNGTNDPLLVTGMPLGGAGSTRFVLPGIADLNSGVAAWRSDVRLFNSGAAPQSATLTFYPLANAAASISKTVTVNPGEVLALDNVLQSTFGVTNAGGALHTTTAVTSPLIVTARTYDQTTTGTRGQFIPAVTQAEAVGSNDRALNILQAEESVRYRTNLGVAEVTGKPAIVEITISLPDSRVSPRVQVPLGAYESLQLPILNSLGIGATYNARISVRVIDGEGKITAYGSVVDMQTQDPTYIPAQ
ncbi:MAG: hypothetical protein QOI24_381 [Acidobacteriota bacterium]|jgi:uncharacterized repeat protein (TIGR01451 family)|nr:hypothetical protein [Acidobacteriota bacterium]